jgi:hypothetical protein
VIAHAIALRDEIALHLDVLQHLRVRAVVAGEQRLEDLLALVRELAAQDPVAEVFARRLAVLLAHHALEQLLALVDGNEEERMVADLDEELRVDLIVREVRVRADLRALILLAEAEAAAHCLARREDPVEAVERALVDGRVVLERAHDARDDGALRGAVGSVEQDESVRPSLADEVRHRAVDLLLHLLLPDEGVRSLQRIPRQVEEVPARELAPRLLDDLGAVMIERVAHVATRVAREAHRVTREEIEVLGEREDATPFQESLLDALGDRVDLAYDARLLCHGRKGRTKSKRGRA